MPSLSVRVAAATAAARADHVDRCAFCRATGELEDWREEDYPAELACVDEDACHARFLALNGLDTAETLHLMRSPFYIKPTDDGPRGSYDVCQHGIRSADDDGPDEVVFNGSLDHCRDEYPSATLRGT